jgi:hypothetical protein
MKKILLTLLLISISFLYSQTNQSLDKQSDKNEIGYYLETDVFTPEWRESLNERINFITFYNPKNKKFVEFRIYRGNKEKYKVSIVNSLGKKLIECDLKQCDQINVSKLPSGIYSITAQDEDENTITKKISIM